MFIRKKFKPLTKEFLKELPEDLQKRVLNTLKAFDECQIEYKNGEYKIGCICLRSSYPKDFRVVGTFYQDEIYTLEERIENYRQEFKCEPYYLLQQLKNQQ